MSEEQPPEDDKKKPLTERQKAKAREGFQIYTSDPNGDNLAFIAREFVLCTLPHSDPGEVPEWIRRNGNLTLSIKPGYKDDPTSRNKRICVGYPYGTIPRLLLVWMITEILRTKNRRLELGNSLSDFMATLGLNSANGSVKAKRSDARRLNNQLERLINSVISFEYSVQSDTRHGKAWRNMQVAPKGMLWWSDKSPEDLAWGSWIEASEDFYNAVISNPYPLDIRVLRYVKDSALGIDLYTILNREAYRASKEGKPSFLAWEWLHIQTGNELADIRDFRRNALVQIEQILEAHSGLIVSIQKGRRGQRAGLVISNLSTPSIRAEQFSSTPKLETDPTSTPALAIVPPSTPPATRHLKPVTIEEFRLYYPVLDPYACQQDFDAWLKSKPDDKQPKSYDRAFLGFASKWVKGKI